MLRTQILALAFGSFSIAQNFGDPHPKPYEPIEDEVVPGCADRQAGTLPVDWCYPPIVTAYNSSSNTTSNRNGTSNPWKSQLNTLPSLYRQVDPRIKNIHDTCEPAVNEVCDLLEQFRKSPGNDVRGLWYSSIVNDTDNSANKCLVGFNLPYDWYDDDVGIHPPKGVECKNNILGPLLDTLEGTENLNLNASVNVKVHLVLETSTVSEPTHQDGKVFLLERPNIGNSSTMAINASLPQFLIAP